MTTRTLAVLVGSIVAASCAPGQQQFLVEGELPGTAGTTCMYTATSSGLLGGGLLPVYWEEYYENPTSDQQLHYYMALSLLNNLASPQETLANGTSVTTIAINDLQVTEIDATFTTDGTGPSVPDVVVPADGFVAGEGGTGVALFDLMSGASSKALENVSKDFKLLANITVKGVTGGSSTVVSNAFQFPIYVSAAAAPTCATGQVLTFTGGPCGEIQDTVTPMCVALDGGA